MTVPVAAAATSVAVGTGDVKEEYEEIREQVRFSLILQARRVAS